MSVLPGLWDLHVHLIYNGHPNPGAWFKHDAEFESTTVPGSARQMLMAGVTSVRDLAARSRTSQKTSDHLLRMARATGCHQSRQRIGLPRLGPDRHRIEDCLTNIAVVHGPLLEPYLVSAAVVSRAAWDLGEGGTRILHRLHAIADDHDHVAILHDFGARRSDSRARH